METPSQNEAVAESQPLPQSSIIGRLGRAFTVYAGATFGIRALNFLLVILYAHYLFPRDYGIIYMAEITASFLVIFQGLSLDSALQRLYFQYQNDSEKLRDFVGSVLVFGFAWMLFLLGIFLFLGKVFAARFQAHSHVLFYPYVGIALVAVTATLGIQYRLTIFQVAKQPRLYARFSIVLAMLTAAYCLVEVVIWRHGALGMLKGKLAAAVCTLLFALWSMKSLLPAHFHWKYIRESLAFSAPLIPHVIMASGLIVADRFILDHYVDLGQVGIYSLAYTLGMVMYLVTQALSQAWFPMFFELAEDGATNRALLGKICSGLAIGLSAIACVGILLAPMFIRFVLDARYWAAVRIVPLVIAGYLFHALFSLFDLAILHAKRTASVFLISSIAFAVNIGLNFFAIPRWGIYGAGWATTAAYAVEAAGAYFLAQRSFRLPYHLMRILASLAIVNAALWLTQIPLALRERGLFLLAALPVSLGCLLWIGRRDMQSALARIRRKHHSLQDVLK